MGKIRSRSIFIISRKELGIIPFCGGCCRMQWNSKRENRRSQVLAVDTYVSHFTRLRLTLCGFLLFVDNGRCADSTYLSSLLGSQFLVNNIYLLAFVDRSHSSRNFFIPCCMLHCYSMSYVYSITTDRCLRWPEYSTRWCMEIWDPSQFSSTTFFCCCCRFRFIPGPRITWKHVRRNWIKMKAAAIPSRLAYVQT